MWLLLESYIEARQRAVLSGFIENDGHRSELKAVGFGAERISSSQGNTATITVTGVLTQEPDIMALIFGGGNTTYPEIIGAIAEANADKNIKEISMFIDSPGGSVAGMFQAMDAVRDSKKPITVIGGNIVASAAYGIASQASKIVASHRSSRFGSIGTVASFFVDEGEISIASDNAPNKRPDVSTDEGISAVKAELNQMADMLDEGIAEGRNTTVKKVNANFGKGGMVLAEAAEKQGMIDGMVGSISKTPAVSASASGITQEALTMDLKTLQAEHPAVYAEAMAIGTSQEQERVSAHLSSGEACGDMSIAMKAISEGVAYSHAPTVAAYNNASMLKNHTDANVADDQTLGASADSSTAPATPTESSKDEITLAAVEAAMGSGEGGPSFMYQGGAK